MALAIVFPGQGSQSLGMLGELAQQHAQVKQTFDEASGVLDYDLWALVQDGPEEQLNSTDHTQPAMLTAGVATWRVWCDSGGPQPSAMAGHSLGEYTALVCAGALTFGDAVSLVAARGRYMQEAVPVGTGAMAAILGLDDNAVSDACARAAEDQVVSAANYNAPGQVVVAGEKDAVDRAIAVCKEVGARRAVLLPVSVPSHCALMRPAAEKLAQRLDNISIESPRIPILHNADVMVHDAPDAIRDVLTKQLHAPVRWVETVNKLAANGADTVVECGPGKVLTGLSRRIDKSLQAKFVQDGASLEDALGAAEERT